MSESELTNIIQDKMMLSSEVETDRAWDPVHLSQPEAKRPRRSPRSPSFMSETSLPSQGSDVCWTGADIGKAGLLLGPAADRVTFHDEDEMRRVFSLLYDVFRYKGVLKEALIETGFIENFPEFADRVHLVWLLFYDLHKRRFLPREHAEAAVCKEMFKEAGLMDIEEVLWKSRVKLAAALARLRIKNNALRLNQLLPNHLRDENLISLEDTPVTGWVNTFKTDKKEICQKVESLGLNLQSKHENVLMKTDFRFDHLCPKLLLCHPCQRAEIAQSGLVKTHQIILQDRAFCLGPAFLSKVLQQYKLRGTVAQTHINSPRTTAYLSAILADNDKVEKVMAFGAGERVGEYEQYLKDLGVLNCEIRAEKFTEFHPESMELENLVAVLATPPNSYTGVTDPVDLVCSRGGDMSMLKSLTQNVVEENASGVLVDQRDTLKFAMSMPQVQIILYETHSVSPSENLDMVHNVIEEMNNWATEKHNEEHRIYVDHDEDERSRLMTPGTPGQKDLDSPVREIEVPPCDLYEVGVLPDLCNHGEECVEDEGCFIAFIQRKEIISLDAKYMIKIAEARGLFGGDVGHKRSSTSRAQKRREELSTQRSNSGSGKPKSRRIKLELDRIAAPTQASIQRHCREPTFGSVEILCPRHFTHSSEQNKKVNEARRARLREWWKAAFKFIIRLMPYNELTPRTKAADSINKKLFKGKLSKELEESVRRLSATNKPKIPKNLDFKPSRKFWEYASLRSIENFFYFKRLEHRNNNKNKETWNANQAWVPTYEESRKLPFRFDFTERLKETVRRQKEDQFYQSLLDFIDVESLKAASPDVFYLKKPRNSSRKEETEQEADSDEEEDKNGEAVRRFESAYDIFRKIEDRVKNRDGKENEENVEIRRETRLKNTQEPENIYNLMDDFEVKKKEKKNHLILSDKYLPGANSVTEEQKEFVDTLKKKLKDLQKQKTIGLTKQNAAKLAERLFSSRKENSGTNFLKNEQSTEKKTERGFGEEHWKQI